MKYKVRAKKIKSVELGENKYSSSLKYIPNEYDLGMLHFEDDRRSFEDMGIREGV
jgi:hypothetical protein